MKTCTTCALYRDNRNCQFDSQKTVEDELRASCNINIIPGSNEYIGLFLVKDKLTGRYAATLLKYRREASINAPIKDISSSAQPLPRQLRMDGEREFTIYNVEMMNVKGIPNVRITPANTHTANRHGESAVKQFVEALITSIGDFDHQNTNPWPECVALTIRRLNSSLNNNALSPTEMLIGTCPV